MLINCPNCENKISEFASVCVNCKKTVHNPNNRSLIQNQSRPDVVSQKKQKPKTWLIVLLCVFALPVGLLIGIIGDKIKKDKPKQQIENYSKTDQNYQNSSIEENTCTICGQKFLGKGYEEVSDGVWKPCQEPYQCYICSKTCGMRHTRQMNKLMNSTYHTGSNGRIYENNACSLCKGTGIEMGKNVATGEVEGRVCPMCDGKGVRSY